MRSIFVIVLTTFSFFASGQSDYPLETILQKGHSKYITCSDFHPSGKYAVTGGYDHAIMLWNLENGKVIRMYNRHTGPVWSVVFSPEGDQILTTSSDQTIKLFNVLTGELIHSISMTKDDVRQAYFSTDGSKLILINNRDGVFIHDRKSGKLIGSYVKNYSAFYQRRMIDPTGKKVISTTGYKSSVVIDIESGDTLLEIPFDKTYGMEFSPDGTKIALSSSKLFAKIFDANTGKEIADLTDPDSEERCDGCNTKQVWSNTGKYLLTMSNKVDAILWDASSGKKMKAYCDVRERPVNLKFSPNDEYILISIDDEVFVYNLKSGKQSLNIKNDQISYYEINFSPDSKFIILPGTENDLELWDIQEGRKKKSIGGFLNKKRDDGLKYSYTNWTDASILKYISMRRGFALSPDNKFVAIGNIDSTALLVDLSNGKVVREFIGHHKVVLALDFSPDGKTLCTAGGDRNIMLWDVATGKLKETIKGHRNLIFDVSYSSDGKQLATASWDGTMGIWNLEDGTFLLKDMGGNSPYCIGFTPNDLYVVTGDLGNQINFWEIDAGESFRSLVGHTNILGDFDFSPDGKQIVTASWDGKVKVWDVLTGMLIGRSALHGGPVYAVAYDPANRFIASGGADNVILLWDANANKLLAKLEGHSSAVTDIAISQDGKKLISMSVDGMVKVWDLEAKTEVYSRIQISRNEWLTTNKYGYFDGSSKALNLVNYVSGMEVVPVSSMFDKYYTPNLIQRISAGEAFNDSGENMNKMMQSTPNIAFHLTNSNKRSVEVLADSAYQWKKEILPLGIEINDNGEDLEEIRIYNNGKLILSESLEKELVFRGGENDIRIFEIPLNDGENQISAVVINKNRSESNPASVLVTYDGVAAKTDLYILALGINEYKNPQYNLDYAVNDSKSFTKAIKAGADSLFSGVFTYLLTNSECTKATITAIINEIKEKIGPEDVFLFYYAGHGVMSYAEKDEDSDFYIVTYDVTNLYGDIEMLNEKALSATELMQFSMEISAEKQLFILDACHSGGALDAFATRGDGREKALAQLARSTGTFFLTASQDAQYANEVGNLKHGLFTYALLELLEGTISDNGDGKITVSELKSYVEERVPELSEQYRGSPQYPTSYSFGQDFPVVIIR